MLCFYCGELVCGLLCNLEKKSVGGSNVINHLSAAKQFLYNYANKAVAKGTKHVKFVTSL